MSTVIKNQSDLGDSHLDRKALSLSPSGQQQNGIVAIKQQRRPFPFSYSISNPRLSQAKFTCNCKNFHSSRTDFENLSCFSTSIKSIDDRDFLDHIPRTSIRGLQTLQKILGVPQASRTISGIEEHSSRTKFNLQYLHKELSDRLRSTFIVAGGLLWAVLILIWTSMSTRRYPKPRENDLFDVTFVSLHFESRPATKEQRGSTVVKEAGVSIFDTRNILHPGIRPERIISTRHFTIEGANSPFNHGKSELTCKDWLLHYLQQLFCMSGTLDADQKQRKIVLVGHGIHHEISLLREMGIDLRNSPALVLVIDTSVLVSDIIGGDVKYRLRDLAKQYGMKDKNFHNSGNNANVALRIMLLLAIKYCNGVELADVQQERVQFYEKMCADQ